MHSLLLFTIFMHSLLLLTIFMYFLLLLLHNSWVLNGELQDTYQEFFVGSKTMITASGAAPGAVSNMWLDVYYLRSSMLPTFLTPAVAEKALVIGKSINYIRLCLSKAPKIERGKGKSGAKRGGLRRGMSKPSVAAALGFGVEDRATSSIADRRTSIMSTSSIGSRATAGTKDATAQQLRDRRQSKQNLMDVVEDGDGDKTGNVPGDKDDADSIDGEEEEKMSLGGRRQSLRSLLGARSDPGTGRRSEVAGDEFDGGDDSDDDDADDDGALLGPAAYAEIEESLHALRYGSSGDDGDGSDGDSGLRLSELVTRISVATDAKLLRIMTKRFHLETHLLALKKFMLLGQGDFVTCLMDSVGPELKKRANQLYRHNLTGMLEGALRSSNAQFEPPHVLDRVSVRLLEPSQGDTGYVG